MTSISTGKNNCKEQNCMGKPLAPIFFQILTSDSFMHVWSFRSRSFVVFEHIARVQQASIIKFNSRWGTLKIKKVLFSSFNNSK